MLDRGLDNWMIKICWHDHCEESPSSDDIENNIVSPPNKPVTDEPVQSPALVDIRPQDSRTGTPQPATSGNNASPHIHIGAIDNSLAFPWKHPDEWRSFPLYVLRYN